MSPRFKQSRTAVKASNESNASGNEELRVGYIHSAPGVDDITCHHHVVRTGGKWAKK